MILRCWVSEWQTTNNIVIMSYKPSVSELNNGESTRLKRYGFNPVAGKGWQGIICYACTGTVTNPRQRLQTKLPLLTLGVATPWGKMMKRKLAFLDQLAKSLTQPLPWVLELPGRPSQLAHCTLQRDLSDLHLHLEAASSAWLATHLASLGFLQ